MTKEEKQNWLDSLKAGDEIAYAYGVKWVVAKVKKRTPTGRIVTESVTFDANGWCKSDGYNSPSYCCPVTVEIKESIRQRILSDKIAKYPWYDAPLDLLEKVFKCLPKK